MWGFPWKNLPYKFCASTKWWHHLLENKVKYMPLSYSHKDVIQNIALNLQAMIEVTLWSYPQHQGVPFEFSISIIGGGSSMFTKTLFSTYSSIQLGGGLQVPSLTEDLCSSEAHLYTCWTTSRSLSWMTAMKFWRELNIS